MARLIPLEKFHFDVTVPSLPPGEEEEEEGEKSGKGNRGETVYHWSRSGRKGDIVRKCRGLNPLFSNSPLARSVCQ